MLSIIVVAIVLIGVSWLIHKRLNPLIEKISKLTGWIDTFEYRLYRQESSEHGDLRNKIFNFLSFASSGQFNFDVDINFKDGILGKTFIVYLWRKEHEKEDGVMMSFDLDCYDQFIFDVIKASKSPYFEEITFFERSEITYRTLEEIKYNKVAEYATELFGADFRVNQDLKLKRIAIGEKDPPFKCIFINGHEDSYEKMIKNVSSKYVEKKTTTV